MVAGILYCATAVATAYRIYRKIKKRILDSARYPTGPLSSRYSVKRDDSMKHLCRLSVHDLMTELTKEIDAEILNAMKLLAQSNLETLDGKASKSYIKAGKHP